MDCTLQELIHALKGQLLIISSLYILAFIAVAVDFVSGIRRARREGKLRTSIGYRKSINKVNQYGMFLTILSVLDLMTTVTQILPAFGLRDLPFVTFIGCAILCIVEAKSVWENSDRGRRAEIKTTASALIELLKKADDREELLQQIAEALRQEEQQ